MMSIPCPLSFSLKEPFDFITQKNFPVNKIPFSDFQTAQSPALRDNRRAKIHWWG
jgi:hypothetical protein